MTTTLSPWTRNGLLNDLFGDFLAPTHHKFEGWNPNMNLAESENDYTVSLDVPGMELDDLDIEFRNGELWVSGERKAESEDDKGNFTHRESVYGKFRRAVRLNGEIDSDKIVAEYENGVLTITIPKAEAVKPKHIEIKSKSKK